ncbi:MAG: hypothetical protein JWM11_5562 [Planctomycetaceae bacterium]|nr:hypothetical protein [Planctomycetaceae bacterium]
MNQNPLPDERTPEEHALGVTKKSEPDADTVEVDAGTSSAIHELELEEAIKEDVLP